VTVTLVNFAGATKDAVFVIRGAGGWTSGEIVVPQPTGTKDETKVIPVPAANSASVVVRDNGELVERYSWQDSTNCHPADIKITHTCAGIEVEIDNPKKGTAHTIKLVPTHGDTVTRTVQPGEKATFKFDAPNDEDTFKVEIFVGDKPGNTVTWERPNGCEELDGTIEETCTGMIFHLSNPQDGSPAAIVLTPTPGEPVSFTLNPGESKDVEFLAGPSGLTVSGTLNGESLGEPLVWEKPEDCPPPILPRTGDNTAGYIASGTGLVALGAIVFFLARRRMMHLRRLAS
jgi:LPXTG-motif cell wall-anchored protein